MITPCYSLCVTPYPPPRSSNFSPSLTANRLGNGHFVLLPAADPLLSGVCAGGQGQHALCRVGWLHVHAHALRAGAVDPPHGPGVVEVQLHTTAAVQRDARQEVLRLNRHHHILAVDQLLGGRGRGERGQSRLACLAEHAYSDSVGGGGGVGEAWHTSVPDMMGSLNSTFTFSAASIWEK